MISPFLAALLIQAAPATPATPAEPPPTNPVQTAAMAFAGCVQGKMASVPAALTPEAGADDILRQCEAQRALLEQEVERTVANAPPETKAMARERLKSGIERGRQGLIDGIRSSRTATGK